LISNCQNEGKVTTYDFGYAGGIGGTVQCTTITDCTNSAQISSQDAAGGICYWMYGSNDLQNIIYVEMRSCTNTGDIVFYAPDDQNFHNADYGGGTAAVSSSAVRISNCTNTGNVFDFQLYGGIIGASFDIGTQIISCDNFAQWIIGKVFAGGICGGWGYENVMTQRQDQGTVCQTYDQTPTIITGCTSCGNIAALIAPYSDHDTTIYPSAGGIVVGSTYSSTDGNTRSPEDAVYTVSDCTFNGISVSVSASSDVVRIVGQFLPGSDNFFDNTANSRVKLTGTDFGVVRYWHETAEQSDINNIWNGISIPTKIRQDIDYRYCKGWTAFAERKTRKKCP
jgi:hypothetical protein